MFLPPANDYTTVTEIPGSEATQEQLARLYHRYRTAKQYATKKRVLEVACGAGLGLGYLMRTASSVIGGDYTANVLSIAQANYHGQIPLLRLDAHHLPFRDRSFDLVIVLEAIYYLNDVKLFVAEAHRVLDRDGILLIGTVNKDWGEFAPSPFSTGYFSVPDLGHLLEQNSFRNLEFYGAFSTEVRSAKQRLVSLVRRLAIALNLIPRTLKGRARFKRIFYGNLSPIPAQVTDSMADYHSLEKIPPDSSVQGYKIIYCAAKRS